MVESRKGGEEMGRCSVFSKKSLRKRRLKCPGNEK
jgi:hypothetical protein